MKMIKRKVHLFDYNQDYEGFIKAYDDLPYPEFIIYDNKLFKHTNTVSYGYGEYRKEPGIPQVTIENWWETKKD